MVQNVYYHQHVVHIIQINVIQQQVQMVNVSFQIVYVHL